MVPLLLLYDILEISNKLILHVKLSYMQMQYFTYSHCIFTNECQLLCFTYYMHLFDEHMLSLLNLKYYHTLFIYIKRYLYSNCNQTIFNILLYVNFLHLDMWINLYLHDFFLMSHFHQWLL
jgi:hypothetical protein